MSSKSKKHSSPSARKSAGEGQAVGPVGAGHPHGGAHHGDFDPDEPTTQDFLEAEELLKTPKGKNPLVYAFLVFLLIFLLIIFILPNSLLSGGGGRTDGEAMTWEDPVRGHQMLRQSEFLREANAYSQIFEVATGRRPEFDPEQVASFLVMDALALENGVTVSDQELAEQLGQIGRAYGSKANFLARLNSVPGGPKGFQESLRRFLRGERFRQLSAYLASIPNAGELRTQWETTFQEFAFDLVAVEIASKLDAARAELPDDAGLEAWWNGRPEFEQRAFWGPEVRIAKLVRVPLPSDPGAALDFDASALAAAFSLPADWDQDAEGDTYYKRNYFRRFKYETPPVDQPEQLYAPYESVKERAGREATLQRQFADFLASLKARREAGESIDLAAEAEKLGLAVLADGAPRTQIEWRELEGFGGDGLMGQMQLLREPGQSNDLPIVDRGGLLAAQLVERKDSAPKPFAEIRAQVEPLWIDARAKELAKAELDGLRAELLPEPPADPAEPTANTVDSERFLAAAAARGLSVSRREYLPRDHRQVDDPAYEEPLHEFLRTNAPAYNLAEGQLGEVTQTVDASRFVLVRAAGQRPMAIERMTAKQWDSLYQRAQATGQMQFTSDGPLSTAALKERFGLKLIEAKTERPRRGPPAETTDATDAEGELPPVEEPPTDGG